MTRHLDQHLRARQSVDRASLALKAHRPTLALDLVREILRQHPGDLTARVIEARATLAMGQPHDALDALETIFLYHQHHGPRDAAAHLRPDAKMLRAESLMQCEFDDLASTQIDHLRRDFPDDVRCHRLAAELAIKQQRHDDAIAALREIVRLEPSDTSARGLLARHVAENDPDAACDWLEGVTSDAARQLERARLYRRIDRLADAEACYAAMIEEHRDDANLWREAGEIAMAIGHDAAAVNRLNHAARISEVHDNAALHALATAHMQAGRFPVAGRCWWRATRRDDTDVRAWAGLMICCHCRNRLKPAQRAAAKLQKHSSKAQRQRVLAELWPHAAGGQVIAPSAASRNPHDNHTTFERLLNRAADVLGHHLDEHPRRADMHYHRAICLDALGRKQDARSHVLEALAINPDYQAARKLAA